MLATAIINTLPCIYARTRTAQPSRPTTPTSRSTNFQLAEQSSTPLQFVRGTTRRCYSVTWSLVNHSTAFCLRTNTAGKTVLRRTPCSSSPKPWIGAPSFPSVLASNLLFRVSLYKPGRWQWRLFPKIISIESHSSENTNTGMPRAAGLWVIWCNPQTPYLRVWWTVSWYLCSTCCLSAKPQRPCLSTL